MLAGKNVLLGVTGGIAVYKAVDLASRLVKAKANVKVIMTDSACEFVSPLTFRSLTHQSVVTEMFDAQAPIEHISLADWCDIAVIAPATANIIGKIAYGIADDLLSTAIMATKAPKLIVPAMNVNMWENSIVQENINRLEKHGYNFMPPDSGMLACGYEGKGRFPEPAEIISFIASTLFHTRDLAGKTVLITAGACREHIDPMRYLSNRSSGKMGIAIAKAVYQRGGRVILIHSDVKENLPYYLNDTYYAPSADDMLEICKEKAGGSDIVIMTAAVTDYKPLSSSDKKIKKTGENITFQFKPTIDILKELYQNRRENQFFIGFAAETDNLVENGSKKLHKCDMLVVNDIAVAGDDNTSITILNKESRQVSYAGSKFAAAHEIISNALQAIDRIS